MLDDIADNETDLKDDSRTELRLWLRLYACASMIERRVQRNLRTQFDLTMPRFDVLSQLYRVPEGVTLSELSRRLMVSNGNVTGVIDRLDADGLVERWVDPDDRRVQRVRLSPQGERIFNEIAPANHEWIAEMTSGLGRGEITKLCALLDKLKQSIRSAPGGGR